MKRIKTGLKLIATHAIIAIVEFFLLIPLLGIWENSKIYQWSVGFLFIAIYWFILYADISYTGQNDVKRGRFNKVNGFLIGLVATIPSVIFLVLSFIIKSDINWMEIILRVWLSPYTKLFVHFEQAMPLFSIIVILLLPIVTGISYLDGPRRRKKITDAIEKSDALRHEKSKVD